MISRILLYRINMYVDMAIIVRFLWVIKAWGTLACLFFLSTTGETEAQKTSD